MLKTRIINTLIKNKEIFTFCILYLLLYFNLNNKTYIVSFILINILIFFLLKKNIFESVLITFFLSIPFENSLRYWIFLENLSDQSYEGHSYYFGLSIKTFYSIFIFLLLFLNKNKNLNNKNNLNIKHANIYLSVFLFISIITSVFLNEISSMTIPGINRLWIGVLIFYSSQLFFSNIKNKKIFYSLIISFALIINVIAVQQFIKQKPVGKNIELTPLFSVEKGHSTTDGSKQYRVSSFFSHPIFFGSFMMILISTLLGILFNFKNNKAILLTIIIIITSIISTLGALSRSTWIILIIIFYLFYKYNKTYKIKTDIFKQIIIKKLFFMIICLTIVIMFIPISTRINSVTTLNKEQSSFKYRLELLKNSLIIIKNHPIIGIGVNNYSLEVYKQKIAKYNLSPVHNTFLLFASELGIPATLIFMLFLFKILYIKNPIKNLDPIKYGCWVGCITFILSSQFHTLFNLDSTFDFTMFILGYLSTWQQIKT